MESLQRNTYQAIPQTSGIYIHIPFCRRRCHYCDFPVQVIGDRKSTHDIEGSSYVNVLLQDLDATFTCLQKQYNYKNPISSIYFGGGTPSLLDSVNLIINNIKRFVQLTIDCEITMEADPGTFDSEYLSKLEDIGVNRLSMGIQSFNNDMLSKCGRPHTVEDSLRAFDLVHRSSFRHNFNIDLISSLPYMTLDIWEDTLVKAIDVDSSHISVYDLQIEEKTAFGRWYSPGIFPMPTEGQAADMYRLGVNTLTSHQTGFEHYEVSNYCKPNKQSRHNLKYWNCDDVIGIGMSAASLVRGKRFTRPSRRPIYESWVKQRHEKMESLFMSFSTTNMKHVQTQQLIVPPSSSLSSSSLLFNPTKISTFSADVSNTKNICNNETNTNDINYSDILSMELECTNVDILDKIMLALRTSQGLCLESTEKQSFSKNNYGNDKDNVCTSISVANDDEYKNFELDKTVINKIRKILLKYYVNDSYVEFYTQTQQQIDGSSNGKEYVKLTDPKGFIISNSIISSIFAELDN